MNFQDSEISHRISKKDLIEKTKNDLILYKDSEYAVKYLMIYDSITVEIFLKNSISDIDFDNLKNRLKENFKSDEFRYISKEEAQKIAEKELGIPYNFFEENIFPASFIIQFKSTTEIVSKIKKIMDELKTQNFIDEITTEGLENHSFILKIVT
ncbi:hypothetical protein HU137_11070 [Moheibacter sp. BDHS18]|uniref:FtsX extracellular domain-containing protein n=2 Tax=Moheibacter lacus TaxID=2745851 RepID=A0A838ZTJ8_9FLAO|nr:hypothetical protein [Moheibacter lacus]